LLLSEPLFTLFGTPSNLRNATSARFYHVSHDRADLDRALACYRKSESAGGTVNPDLYMNRGNVYSQLGERALAEADHKKACELDPGLRDILFKPVSK
jgi:tetratricopeptide (TPR) repeat protein